MIINLLSAIITAILVVVLITVVMTPGVVLGWYFRKYRVE